MSAPEDKGRTEEIEDKKFVRRVLEGLPSLTVRNPFHEAPEPDDYSEELTSDLGKIQSEDGEGPAPKRKLLPSLPKVKNPAHVKREREKAESDARRDKYVKDIQEHEQWLHYRNGIDNQCPQCGAYHSHGKHVGDYLVTGVTGVTGVDRLGATGPTGATGPVAVGFANPFATPVSTVRYGTSYQGGMAGTSSMWTRAEALTTAQDQLRDAVAQARAAIDAGTADPSEVLAEVAALAEHVARLQEDRERAELIERIGVQSEAAAPDEDDDPALD